MSRSPANRPALSLSPRAIVTHYGTVLHGSRRWLGLVTVVFLASLVAGAVGAALNPTAHSEYMRQLGQQFRPTLEALRQGNSLQAILLIFWNNLSILLLMMGTGALILPLLVPVLLFSQNAYLIGALLMLARGEPGQLARAIVPHSLFELPALIIAAAWSLKMAVAWLLPGASGRRGDVWWASIVEGLTLLPLLALLLAIAAVIEVLVSARLTGALGS